MTALIPIPAFSPPAISRRLALSLSLLPLSPPSLSSPLPSLCPSSAPTTSKAFLDISISGIPAGRVTIGLFSHISPASVARFSSLASSSLSPSFRRKTLVKISPTFVRFSGAGVVGIVVRDVGRLGRASRVVARNGRIEVVEEEEAGPNGTEFVIATRDSLEMDEVAVAVGRVVGGMEVVEKIAGVRAVRDNAGSPYFR